MSTYNYDLCPFHGPTCVREIADGGAVTDGKTLHHTAMRPGYDGGAAAAAATAAAGSAATASAAASTNAPTGMIACFAGSAAPSGWLLCDGTAVSRSTYALLFAVTSTLYGVGDGSTTFNLPDLRQRFPMGKAAAGTGSTLGGTGGTVDHTHDAHTVGVNSLGALAGNALEAPATHSAVNPPFQAVNYIVRTGL